MEQNDLPRDYNCLESLVIIAVLPVLCERRIVSGSAFQTLWSDWLFGAEKNIGPFFITLTGGQVL